MEVPERFLNTCLEKMENFDTLKEDWWYDLWLGMFFNFIKIGQDCFTFCSPMK